MQEYYQIIHYYPDKWAEEGIKTEFFPAMGVEPNKSGLVNWANFVLFRWHEIFS